MVFDIQTEEQMKKLTTNVILYYILFLILLYKNVMCIQRRIFITGLADKKISFDTLQKLLIMGSSFLL